MNINAISKHSLKSRLQRKLIQKQYFNNEIIVQRSKDQATLVRRRADACALVQSCYLSDLRKHVKVYVSTKMLASLQVLYPSTKSTCPYYNKSKTSIR